MLIDAQVHYDAGDGKNCTVAEALAVSRAEGVDRIVEVTPAVEGYGNDEALKDAVGSPGTELEFAL